METRSAVKGPADPADDRAMVILPPLASLIVVLIAAGCVFGMLHAITGAIHAETDVHDLRCAVAERLEIRRQKLAELHGHTPAGLGEVEILDDETGEPIDLGSGASADPGPDDAVEGVEITDDQPAAAA